MFEHIPLLATATNQTLSIELTPQMLAAIPLVTLAIQFIKTIPALAKWSAWFPLLSIVVSIVAAVLMKIGTDPQSMVLSGVVMGMASSGLYSSAKLPGAVANNAANPPAVP
jgi:hypothetical protein